MSPHPASPAKAITSSVLLIARVRYGSVRKKLRLIAETTAVTSPGPRPPSSATTIVNARKTNARFEADVAERAQAIFAGAGPSLVHYGVSDSDAFEVGLSCGGEIDVWLEGADPGLWSDVRRLLDSDEYGMLYTNTQTGDAIAREQVEAASKEQVLRAYAAQFAVMENANALAAKAIRTCGGQAMLKSLALERIYRDSRCGSLMLPWTAEICLERLGRETLFEPGERP